ncbi:MAG TPA: GDP-mannose 4,6-dehydratase [Pyrinomonadaceae bacterium]
MKKQILVTGGAGFIGSHLVDHLLSEGIWRVSVVDNFNDFYSPQIKYDNIRKHLNSPDFSLYKADICCRESLRRIFAAENFDAIVHLAARAGVRPSVENSAIYVQTNVDGTLNLLELAKEYNVEQFVFGSSSSIYGINCKIPFSEEDKISKPISPYAATKAAGELLCHTYSHLYDIRTVCLRFFTVYGARQRPDLAIHKFSRLIVENLSVPVFGDGLTRRDYTFIDDAVQGIRAAIDYRKPGHEIFNIGESRTIELKYIIELLEENLGVQAIVERCEMQPGDVPVTFADISKAKNLLGYNPQTEIEEGIPKFVRWFLENRQTALAESIL